MKDQETRVAVFRLAAEKHSDHKIAQALKVSRNTVKRILELGTSEVPQASRRSVANPHREKILELYQSCKGNLVRVQEELLAEGIDLRYSTLTRFCRQNGISINPPKLTGQYHFEPGEEMQHDTSPHKVDVGDRQLLLQCASLVLCFSRMLFAQLYPTFNRFYCKAFLTEAIKRFGGAATRCMVDNTSVLIASGSGKNATPAPEMKAFGDRFGFAIEAHEKGDANRSARVEGPFYYIERNFYPGRNFEDLADLNRQLAQWCEKKSHRFLRELQSRPIDLYQTERQHLKPLPLHIPDVHASHSRMVNLESYVHLHSNRYSVPVELLAQRVQVQETIERIKIYHRHQLVAEHERLSEGARRRVTDKAHFTNSLRTKKIKEQVLPEEQTLSAAAPELEKLVQTIRKESKGKVFRQIRKLHKFYLDYPTVALCQAVGRALEYGLTDLDRIERMILRCAAGDFFKLNTTEMREDDHE